MSFRTFLHLLALSLLSLSVAGCPSRSSSGDDDDDDSSTSDDDDSVGDDDDTTPEPESFACPGEPAVCDLANSGGTFNGSNDVEDWGDVCDVDAGKGPWTGNEDVWEFVPLADGPLSIYMDMNSGVDLDVFVLDSCSLTPGSCLGAGISSDPSYESFSDVPVQEGVPVYIVIDSVAETFGDYSLYLTCPQPPPPVMTGTVTMKLDFGNPGAQFVDCSDVYGLEDSGSSSSTCFDCEVSRNVSYVSQSTGCPAAWTSSSMGTVLSGGISLGVDLDQDRLYEIVSGEYAEGTATGDAWNGSFSGSWVERPFGGTSSYCLDLDFSGTCDPGSEHTHVFEYNVTWSN